MSTDISSIEVQKNNRSDQKPKKGPFFFPGTGLMFLGGVIALGAAVGFRHDDMPNYKPRPNQVPVTAPLSVMAPELCPNESANDVIAWIDEKNDSVTEKNMGHLATGLLITVPKCPTPRD